MTTSSGNAVITYGENAGVPVPPHQVTLLVLITECPSVALSWDATNGVTLDSSFSGTGFIYRLNLRFNYIRVSVDEVK